MKKYILALVMGALFSGAVAEEATYPMVKTLNQNEFDQFIGSGIVVVDFYADWCVPCKKLTPIYKDLAREFQDKVKFAKINIDHAKGLAIKKNVSTIPTIILFENGQEIKRRGSGNKAEIQSWIQSALDDYK